MYDWIAVNALCDFEPGKLTGVLDMGGASTQISFLTKDGQFNAAVTINQRQYPLFSHSFLGLGQDQAMMQFLNDQSCFNKGYILPDQRPGNGQFNLCEEHL